MPSHLPRHSSWIALSIAAGLLALGWSGAAPLRGSPATEATIASDTSGETPPSNLPVQSPADTSQPAADKPAAKPVRHDKPEPEASNRDDSTSDDAPPDDAGGTDAKNTKPAVAPATSPAPAGQKKIRFQFRFMPWKDALEWFAQQAGLSLLADPMPHGTLNYNDDREYTPVEALDLLNGVLLTKGYTLVRRERMLMLINLEDGIPPNLVPTIAPEALDARGEYELVSVLFNLKNLRPAEAEAEIAKLLGPQGSAVPLPKARQLLVTETAGRLRSIRSVLKRIEEVAGEKEGPEDVFGVPRPRRIPLRNTQAQEMADLVRQVFSGRLLEEPRTAGQGAGSREPGASSPAPPASSSGIAGPSLTIGVDPRSNSLLVVAPRELFQEVKQLVDELDLAAGERDKTMRVVPLHGVTAEAVEQVLAAAAGDRAQIGARVPPAARPASTQQPGIGQGRLPAAAQGAAPATGAAAPAGGVRSAPLRSPNYRGGSALSPPPGP